MRNRRYKDKLANIRNFRRVFIEKMCEYKKYIQYEIRKISL